MSQTLSNAIHPWQLTRAQWEAERERIRPDVAQSRFTSATASQMSRAAARLQWLIGDVHRVEREQLARATRGEITMSREDAEEILERINARVFHHDVVAWAQANGRDVPPEVLREYEARQKGVT